MHSNNARLSTVVLGSALTALVFAAPSALAYDTEPNWITNSYFSATAVDTTATYVNGAWLADGAPTVAESKFAIDSTQAVFKVTEDRTSDSREVIRVDCAINFADFYYLDDITNDVTSAIAAVSLVTNKTTGAMNWMALTGGDTWEVVSDGGAGGEGAIGSYTNRIELDYSSDTPQIRYSLKSGDDYVVLKKESTDTGWYDTAASAEIMSNVCFCGKADLTSINAKLSTTAEAEVNYVEYDDVLKAMKAAGGSTIVLYTENKAVAESDLRGDLAGKTYTFDSNGQMLTVNDTTWKVSHETGVEASGSGTTTITVSAEKALVAKILDTGDDPNAYLTLADAFNAASADQTIVALVDFDENATLTSKAVTLDLGGFAIGAADADDSVITVTGSGAKLFVHNGSITGLTSSAAISAANGAVVTIDELIATNNAKAIVVAGGSTVTITNGLFTGAFDADSDENSKITILGGYYLAKDGVAMSFTSNKTVVTGGKFTGDAATAVAGVIDSNYRLAELAVPFTTNGYTIANEVMLTTSAGENVKVWSVSDDTVGGVQIPDQWISENVTGDDNAAKQADLNTAAAYKGVAGTTTMKKWEAYVLGMTSSTTSEGPVVKGVQDANSDKIGFSILSPAAIKAAESGCDVKFTVQEFTNPGLTEGAGTESDKVDYTGTVQLDAPTSGVRYYKLKMYISPKQ